MYIQFTMYTHVPPPPFLYHVDFFLVFKMYNVHIFIFVLVFGNGTLCFCTNICICFCICICTYIFRAGICAVTNSIYCLRCIHRSTHICQSTNQQPVMFVWIYNRLLRLRNLCRKGFLSISFILAFI